MGFFGILILVILSSCRTLFPNPVEEKTLSSVQSWAYQLQNIDLSGIERSAYDLVVMDYSKNGSEGTTWSSAEIRRVKESGSGKILLAYLSIGEAESHRSYWESSWIPGNPSWLGKEVSVTDGRPRRFNVKYWSSEWQKVLKNLLERMISQGFNGVLLDGCDAYIYWSDFRNGESEVLDRQVAAGRMVELIGEIASYARTRVPDFIVLAQERTKLLTSISSDVSKRDLYIKTIQGVVATGIFFSGEALQDNPFAPETDLIEYFQDLRSRGKVIFSLEYLSQTNDSALERYFREVKPYGFYPYAADRALDTLRVR
ncbi:MAG: endo alpha-1,4 polygalactosaminidase [Spirochaetes bacterium]|nr:endo alpha-1,4 polygalactosaminidase [Spirochaetota bacterium]